MLATARRVDDPHSTSPAVREEALSRLRAADFHQRPRLGRSPAYAPARWRAAALRTAVVSSGALRMIDYGTIALFAGKPLCQSDTLGRPCRCNRCIAIEACRLVVVLKRQLQAPPEVS
jgi:hypothetical protein